MSVPQPSPNGDWNQLIERLTALTDDDERARFFDRHPDLPTIALVHRLCDEVAILLRVDLARADRLAAAAAWVAERLDDGPSRARAARAQANLAHQRWDYEAAARLYDRARRGFDRFGDRKEDAITRSNALQNLIYLGRYEQAHRWYLAARRVFEELDDSLRLARLEMNFGNVLHRQDRWSEAMQRYEAALAVFTDAEEPGDAAIALRNMAMCHISLHNFEQALDCYRRARTLCEAQGWPLLALENDYNIAYLYYERGEYAQAIQLFQEVRRRCEELGDEHHKALCDLDQAEIYLELNLVEEAAQLAQWAFTSFETMGMRYEAAKALVNLAVSVGRQGKVFLALETLAKAREIFAREDNRLWPALLDLYRAMMLYGEGRSFDAERLAASALRVFEETVPSKAAMCEILLARLDLEDENLPAGRARCRRALERLESLNSPSLECQAYFVLGQIEESLGARDEAVAAYRRAHESLERVRSHLQTEELKVTLFDDKLVVYESLVSMCLRGTADQRDTEGAFAYIEKAKARSLADLVAFRAHALPPKSATRSNLVEQIRSLREELNWYYRQIDLRQMRDDQRSRQELRRLRAESREQESRLLRTLRVVAASDQEFGSLQEATTVEPEAIQEGLADGVTLIEYYFSRGAVYACVLRRAGLEVVPLTVVSRVRELYRLLQFQLSKFQLGADYIEEFGEMIGEATRMHLTALHEELVAPLEPLLKGESLVIVPHDFLHFVPFHALCDQHGWMVDRYAVSYAPSAAVFHLAARKRTAPRSEALVLGVGDETEAAAAREARAVAEALPGARLLLGSEATLENLERYGEECAVLHLATHAHFRQDNPLFSSLQLAGSRLGFFDLYGLRLKARMIALTGCGTGLNAVISSDEMVGLTRGLLYAGAESALVTLWDVPEASRIRFVRDFYPRIGAGGDRAQALRETMLELREGSAHPYFWAPYVLVGNPGGLPALD